MIATLLSLLLSGTVAAAGDDTAEFDAAVASHYQRKPGQLEALRRQGIGDDELPVVFFLADRGKVEPKEIAALRKDGAGWWEVSVRLHVGAAAYYVELKKDPGPPYGKAWGRYRKTGRSEWSKFELTDEELVASVNLQFLSEHFDLEPDLVATVRGKHATLDQLAKELKTRSERKKAEGAKEPEKGAPKKGESEEDGAKGGADAGRGRDAPPAGRGSKGRGKGGGR